METAVTIGMDIAKSVFVVHGVDAAGEVVARRRLTRRRVLPFFGKLPAALSASKPARLLITGADSSGNSVTKCG